MNDDLKISDKQVLEIVFDSCNSVFIPASSILFLKASTSKRIGDKEYELKNFYIDINLHDSDKFKTASWNNTPEARNEALRELRECHDITQVYLNDIEYHVPWKHDNANLYSNAYQMNAITTNTSGDNYLSISICEVNDPEHIHVYHNEVLS